jgi:hypothetical protein
MLSLASITALQQSATSVRRQQFAPFRCYPRPLRAACGLPEARENNADREAGALQTAMATALFLASAPLRCAWALGGACFPARASASVSPRTVHFTLQS